MTTLTRVATSRWFTLLVKVNGFTLAVSLLIELGIGIFAGNHEAILHEILPGYVKIRPISRVPRDIYVAPWVAKLHLVMIWVFFSSLAAVLILGIVQRIAKNSDTHHELR